MNKFAILFVLCLFFSTVKSQTKTAPAGPNYPNGYTKHSTQSNDESLNKVTTIEYKDGKGVTIKKETYIETLDGKFKLTDESVTPSGQTTYKSSIELNNEKKITRLECTWYNDEREVRKSVYERTPDGGVQPRGPGGDELYVSPDIVREWEKQYQEKLESISKTGFPTLEPLKSSCVPGQGGNCRPKVEVFAGYSYLRGDYGLDKESFPAGARLAAVYNLSNHIAVGIDASLNSRKIGTENLSRNFIMIEGKYVLGDMDDCDRKLFGNIRLLGGIGIEKFGSSSGSGPAFGAGAGVVHLVTKKVAVRAQADYLAVKYKGSDELNKNIRVSGGVVFRF